MRTEPPMTPSPPNIPTPIETVRDLFEIPDGITYLNCASMSPQLRCVTEAGLRAVRTKAAPWNLSGSEWFSGSEELRALAARVMGTDSDAVALVPRQVARASSRKRDRPRPPARFPHSLLRLRAVTRRQRQPVRLAGAPPALPVLEVPGGPPLS